MRKRRLRLLFFLLLSLPALAEDDDYIGRSIADVIDRFTEQGLPFAYSTHLVTEDLLVLVEPSTQDPVTIVTEILAPHGLTVRSVSGVLVVVPIVVGTDPEPGRGEREASRKVIEEIAVSASRYEIKGATSPSQFILSQYSIETNPDFGDDPLRVAQRLPGAAASGTSARAHFRGGEESEIGIMLNGQRLFDPFHIRDYQSVFSAIDSRAIQDIEVFTGGFPAHYGNRMSGMIIMDSLDAPPDRHNEIGISVYDTSILTAGRHANRNWLISARRGNLDLVIDPQFGSPSYSDVFASFGITATPAMSIAFNTLYANDDVTVVVESDPEDLQQVSSDTQNLQVWLEVDNRWSDRLTSRTVLSTVVFENDRQGRVEAEESIIGFARDHREINQYGFRQDFSFRDSDRHLLEWGLEVRSARAEYDYRNRADYFGLAAIYADRPDSLDTEIRVAPQGASYSIYFSDRWRLTDAVVLEWGLRWDDQTYTGTTSDSQLSPRLTLLHDLDDETELRFSWGRYFQVQDIHELQVEDGISTFWPAQSADQIILGLDRQIDDRSLLRVEAYYKRMRRVRPRFENLFDPLGVIPEIQPDRVRLDPTSAIARGFEVSLLRESPDIDWWATYTWSQVADRINGQDQPRSWDQEHALQLGARWRNERWDLSLAAKIHSGWPSTELTLVEDTTAQGRDDSYTAVPGPRNAGRYPVFGSLDLRVARTWTLQSGSLMAFLEITNLTNRRNECCLDWDLDEPDGAGDVVLERGIDYWMPLLPAIGFRWEF